MTPYSTHAVVHLSNPPVGVLAYEVSLSRAELSGSIKTTLKYEHYYVNAMNEFVLDQLTPNRHYNINSITPITHYGIENTIHELVSFQTNPAGTLSSKFLFSLK